MDEWRGGLRESRCESGLRIEPRLAAWFWFWFWLFWSCVIGLLAVVMDQFPESRVSVLTED